MVVLDPESDEERVGQVVDRVTGIISNGGGEVSGVDRWGRRKLAYEIDKKTEGYYVLVSFRSEPPALPELDRALSLADEVIRFKVIRLDAA